MSAVTQTDRHRSVRNRCVIEIFGGINVWQHLCVLSLDFHFLVILGLLSWDWVRCDPFSFNTNNQTKPTSNVPCFGSCVVAAFPDMNLDTIGTLCVLGIFQKQIPYQSCLPYCKVTNKHASYLFASYSSLLHGSKKLSCRCCP